MTDYTLVDYAILAALFGSTFAGLMRGFLKEVLSLISWIVAGFLASTYATTLATRYSGQTDTVLTSALGASPSDIGEGAAQTFSMLSVGVSFLAIFLSTLLIGSIITYIITSASQATGISITNRFLGALFGLFRGVIIVIIGLFIATLTPITEQAAWTNAKLVAPFMPSATWLGDMVSPSLATIKAKTEKAMQGVSGQVQEIGNTFNSLGR